MGNARPLILALALVAPGVAGSVCEPGVEGLVVTAAEGGLRVAAAAPGSPAAEADVVAGDVVLQVNGARPETCEAWRRSIESAVRDHVSLLVLVARGREQLAFAVAPTESAALVAAAGPAAGAARAAVGAPGAPSERPAPTLPPDLLPDAVPVTRADVVVMLGALGPSGRLRLGEYRERVVETRRALSTLLVRDPGTRDAAALLRIVRRHEAGVVAWEAVEAIQRRQGLRSGMPVSLGATESFFAGSEVAALIDELPVLVETVRTAPGAGRIERAGRWEPMRARALLWAEADALLAELVGAHPHD